MLLGKVRSVAVPLLLLGACTNSSDYPDYVPLGGFESPCGNDDECDSELCVEFDGLGSCTLSCASGTCPDDYECRPDGICAPVLAGRGCRTENQRCGESFLPCCTGRIQFECIHWPGWAPVCTKVDCSSNSSCWSGCCADLDVGVRVCAPPLYCS